METTDPDGPSLIPAITPKLVEQYAYAGGTDADIADRFLLDVETIQTRYPNELRKARGLRRLTLRGWQFDLARKLNGPLLNWLGRNELCQSNNPTSPGAAEPDFEPEDI